MNLNTIREFGIHWLDNQFSDKSAEYVRTTRRALEKDVFPSIGNKPLTEVTPGDVLVICDRIKDRGAPKMALHTRNVLKRMYEYAIAPPARHDQPRPGNCCPLRGHAGESR